MKGSSVFLIAFATSVLTAAGTVLSIERYQLFSAPPPVRQVLAPPLTGLSEADARANAGALRVALLVDGREPAPGVSPGTVVRQDIAPGHPVPEGAGIRVVIAASWPRVPKVVELGFEEAERALAERGYKARLGDAVPHDSVPPGRIARQAPEADVELEPGSSVVLSPSSGPAAVELPKLTGLSVQAATDALSALQLKLVVRWISKAETFTGVVLSQKPAPGEKVAPGSNVEVVVNR